MSTENEKRLLRCCFTGHRPGKLHMSELQIKHALAAAIESACLLDSNVQESSVQMWFDETKKQKYTAMLNAERIYFTSIKKQPTSQV